MRRPRLRLELLPPPVATQTKIRFARVGYLLTMAARRLTGRRSANADSVRNGLRWSLDLREGIDLSIYLLGRFEVGVSRTLDAAVRPGMTVVDIGANVGAHTLPLARSVGADGLVVALEPTAWAYRRLQHNLALNPELEGRVRALQVALGEPGGSVPETLFSSWNLSATGEAVHATHGGSPKSTDGCTATTLDQVVAEQALSRVDLIKLDVDGFEAKILRGGRDTLTRLRPQILLELCSYTLAEQGDRLDDLLELLWSAGYDLRQPRGDPLPRDRRWIEQALPRGGSINVLAVPGLRPDPASEAATDRP